ncbi:MAG: PUA domain-containing protein [Candidatus Woesearchaeota archaeon]
MSRKQFSKKDIKEFLLAHPEVEGVLTKKSDVVQKEELLYVDGTLSFIDVGGWIPSLILLQTRPEILPKVTVDKGAIKFLVNGADVMRPGITDAEEFNQGDMVVVVDETVGKPISVCKALYDSNELLGKDSGKVLENYHHVGDSHLKRK